MRCHPVRFVETIGDSTDGGNQPHLTGQMRMRCLKATMANAFGRNVITSLLNFDRTSIRKGKG